MVNFHDAEMLKKLISEAEEYIVGRFVVTTILDGSMYFIGEGGEVRRWENLGHLGSSRVCGTQLYSRVHKITVQSLTSPAFCHKQPTVLGPGILSRLSWCCHQLYCNPPPGTNDVVPTHLVSD